MSNAATMLRRGYTFDPECWHATNRLQLATRILDSTIGPKRKEHAETCDRHPKTIANTCFSYRDRLCCTCGVDRDPLIWPDWVDDEILDKAWALACALQTKRGAHEHNRQNRTR